MAETRENRTRHVTPGSAAMRTLTGLAIVLPLWLLASFIIGENLVPSPLSVIPVLMELTLSGGLMRHAGASLVRLVIGIAIAGVVAVPLGVAAGTARGADRIISPVVYVLYPVPKIAFLPVFMILFGLGDASKVILLVSVIVFQLVIAVRDGVRGIPREYHYAAKNLQLTGRERLFRLYLPSALPQVFSAVRISVGIGIAVLFLAENYATRYGLGYFIMNNWVMINYPRMFAGILALGILAAALLTSLDAAERWLCPWAGGNDGG